MAREFQRSRRIEEQIQRLLSDVIRTQVRDPRVEGVVVTHVRVSRDLGVAWVYYSTWDGARGADPTLQAGLERAAGFLRSYLARELGTRTVPDLRFRFDDQGERSRELDRLIDAAVGESTEGPSPGQDGGSGNGHGRGPEES
jgi:ribosome-binding factor A